MNLNPFTQKTPADEATLKTSDASSESTVQSVFSPSPANKPTTSPHTVTPPIVSPLFTPSAKHPATPAPTSAQTSAYVPNSSPSVSGVIGPRMVINGDIEFEGELMVQGRVTGNIRSTTDDNKSVLRIEENAEVTGDVTVPIVKVAGKLKGNVSASELLHLQMSGVIEGPVKYNNIQLESGGTLAGSLSPDFKNARK